MPYSSRKKTRWYSDSEPRGQRSRAQAPACPARSADRAARRLAPVHQLLRQGLLAQAGGARPGAAQGVARAGLRILGLEGHQPADRPRGARGHRGGQRRRQEHAAAAAGADLPADLGDRRGPRQRRPDDRDGSRFQSPSSRASTTSCSTGRCSASPGARCCPRWRGSTSSPACASSPTSR